MNSVPRSTPAYRAWLLPAGTLLFICGIVLGRSLTGCLPAVLAAVLCGCAAVLSRQWRRLIALLMLALSLGTCLSWRTFHPALLPEGEYTVCGTVTQELVRDERGRVQTVLTDVTLDGASAGEAYWTFYPDKGAMPDWLAPGVRVQVSARMYHPGGTQNPEGFNFRDYLLQRGIRIGIFGAEDMQQAEGRFSVRGGLAALRHRLTQRLMDAMGEESGAYAAAMLLGTRDFIAEEDMTAFRDLGIVHILSVSGYHVGVLAAMLAFCLRPLPIGRKANWVLEVLLLALYALLTGGNAPVVRAVLLWLWREYTHLRNRQVLPLHLLCVSALIQLAAAPSLLVSASFQLTYGAMAGLLLVYPWLRKRRICRTKWGTRVWEAFTAALAAQLGILLPQLYWFGELPLLSIVLNMAVIPLAGVLMTLYWLTLAALPVPGLAAFLGTLSAWGTKALLTAVRALASLDIVSLWTRRADALVLIGWVLLLLSLSTLVPRKFARARRWGSVLGALLVASILLPIPEWQTAYTQFSVGDADAAVLQDRGVTVVIDTGEDGRALAEYLQRRRQKVELLVLTHLHTDHAGGVQALLDAGITVEKCCLPADAMLPQPDSLVMRLLTELSQTGTEFCLVSRGDVIDLPSGRMTVLWPADGCVFSQQDANDASMAMYVELRGVTMLLTGDLSGLYEHYAAIPADVLKVAHHGSTASTSEEFRAAVDPQILLLSNEMPSRQARVEALAGDIPLYDTDRHGAVTLIFTGQGRYRVKTWGE